MLILNTNKPCSDRKVAKPSACPSEWKTKQVIIQLEIHKLFDFSTLTILGRKVDGFIDNCEVKNLNFSNFRGNFFARKVEASVPNFYFSNSS